MCINSYRNFTLIFYLLLTPLTAVTLDRGTTFVTQVFLAGIQVISTRKFRWSDSLHFIPQVSRFAYRVVCGDVPAATVAATGVLFASMENHDLATNANANSTQKAAKEGKNIFR